MPPLSQRAYGRAIRVPGRIDAPFHYEQQGAALMAPFVDALITAGVKIGDKVLDVACGTGFATRAASHATGSSGSVVGSDLNPAMVAMAGSVCDHTPTTIEWHEASALDLPFPDHQFDSVICQQGIQFFPDVAAGLREMARVLQPGGALSVSVWAPPPSDPPNSLIPASTRAPAIGARMTF